MNRFYSILLCISLVGLSAFSARAAQKTWLGASNNLWSEASNWQPAGVPGMNDEVVFDGSVSIVDCELSNITIIQSLRLTPNYSGTVSSNVSSDGILTVQGEILLEGGTLSIGASRLKSMSLLNLAGGLLSKGNGGIFSMIDVNVESGIITVENCEVEILGTFTISGGSFELGSGDFVSSGNWNQSGGTFIKSGGVGNFFADDALEISGGIFNTANATLNIKHANLTGGQFIGNNGLYFTGSLNIEQDGVFNKTQGSIYFGNEATLSSSSTFILDNVSFQADDVFVNGGTFNLGSGNVLINRDFNANNASIEKPSGVANISLDNQAYFNNCNVIWGDGQLNFGNLSIDDTDFQLGNGTFQVDGNYEQEGNSQFTKTGGFVTLSSEGTVILSGGVMDFSNCDELVSGSWRQEGGVANHGAINVKLVSRLQLSNDAEYNASSGITELGGSFRKVSGTFNHNGGKVIMNGLSSFTYSILGNPTFHKLEFNTTSGVNNKSIEVYGTINVLSELIFNNANAANRAITVNNGSIWLFGNLNITDYKASTFNSGDGSIRFSSAGAQTILGAPLSPGQGVLPRIRVEKAGGEFLLNGTVSFGNGFSHQNANIIFDPEFKFVMSGGSFMLENLIIPEVVVLGEVISTSNLICMGNMLVEADGSFSNSNQPASINGDFINYGRYQNKGGLTNVTGLFQNHGVFSTNSGSVNALAGINQNGGTFACNNGQVNILGTLAVNQGSFRCNNGVVLISGNLIQSGGTINGNLDEGSMTISQSFTQNAGLYDAKNGTLNIGGILTMNGSFLRGNGTINFNGIGPQNIPALYYHKLSIAGTGRLITLPQNEIRIAASVAGFTPHPTNSYITNNSTINYSGNRDQEVAGFAYHNLIVSRSGTKILTGNATVKGYLQVANSAEFDVDGELNNIKFTLLSSQNSTARIAAMPSTASITGNMIVQRWTRGGIRSNRFFASPVDTVGGIKLKQFKDDILLYGPGGITNGFDNPTVFTSNVSVYDEANPNGSEWRSPANIDEIIPVGKGLLIYHVGDRSQAPLQTNTIPNPVIIDLLGTPNQGTINIPMECTAPCVPEDNGNGWNLVANPYASPIDWNSPEWVKEGVSTTFFIWNPRINQYASYNSANPAAATNGGSRYIGPGQSFFMKATANDPVLIVTENVKSEYFPDTLLFRMAAPQNQLRLVLENKEHATRDEAIFAFDNRAKEGFEDEFDSHKPTLPMMVSNLSLKNDLGDLLGVHTTQEFNPEVSEKVIPLSLAAIAGSYTLSANQISSFSSEFVFYLENTIDNTIQILEEGKKYPIVIEEGKEDKLSNAYQLRISRSSANSSPIAQGIKVYPNPSNGKNITLLLSNKEAGELEITDSMGKRIMNSRISSESNNIEINMPENTSAGIYTLSWKTANKTSTTRLSIQ